LDRLLSVSHPQGTTEYTYDSFGRLIQKQDIRLNGSFETLHFFYRKNHLIGIYKNGKLLHLKVETPHDKPITLHIEKEGKAFSVQTDLFGNIALLSPHDPFHERKYIRTSAFGESTPSDTPFRFQGLFHDDTLDLTYIYKRFYRPSLGRFLTPDPAGFIDGPNLYAYCQNQPLSAYDLNGLRMVQRDSNNRQERSGWNLRARGWGLLQAIGGAIECGAGALASSTGLGAIIGVTTMLHGGDHLYTGLKTVYTGKAQRSLTSQALEKVGLSETAAEWTDAGIGIVLTGGTATALKVSRSSARLASSIKGGKHLAIKSNPYLKTSAKWSENYRKHLAYGEKYGANKIKYLQNGRIRYYNNIDKARNHGKMLGRRYVHEFNPLTGKSRGWHETLDHNFLVRQTRPELNGRTKYHYLFDEGGKYVGKW